MASQAVSSATGLSLAVTISNWKPRVEDRTWWLSSSACNRSRTWRPSFSVGSVRCKAVGPNNRSTFDNSVVYQGLYGPWTVDESDIREVFFVAIIIILFGHHFTCPFLFLSLVSLCLGFLLETSVILMHKYTAICNTVSYGSLHKFVSGWN